MAADKPAEWSLSSLLPTDVRTGGPVVLGTYAAVETSWHIAVFSACYNFRCAAP